MTTITIHREDTGELIPAEVIAEAARLDAIEGWTPEPPIPRRVLELEAEYRTWLDMVFAQFRHGMQQYVAEVLRG